MKPFKLTFFMFLFCTGLFAQDLSVTDLTCEHMINPIGIGVSKPRFSWKITGSGNNIMQTAYSIRVATDEKFSSRKIVDNLSKQDRMNLFFKL